jgi:hypothetical protein
MWGENDSVTVKELLLCNGGIHASRQNQKDKEKGKKGQQPRQSGKSKINEREKGEADWQIHRHAIHHGSTERKSDTRNQQKQHERT